MTTSSLPPSAIVARLRAAGCVFAEDEARLLLDTARTPGDLAAMVDRRAAGLPLEHVLGWAEFCGLRIAVDPGVFVPRRRTEFLVRRAAVLARPGAVLLDLCCGTGALGAALATLLAGAEADGSASADDAAEPVGEREGHGGPEGRRRAEVHAADIDPAAVACARRNLAAVGGRVYEGDLYEPLPATLRGRVDVLLANVPYVPSGDVALLPAEARDHEARVALDGGTDGLDVARRVTAEASAWLAPGGHLLFEASDRQVPAALDAVARAGLSAQVSTCEETDATVVIGTLP
ncbi:HemK family protein methyltransferase [Actinoallomurus spadix]|uniref:Release factor glutamine methyltransferase n=1 Tax=Actinoallomurus spadix TaxID=79912 RepID=A0ABP3HCZ6_9ACTN|nr:HemK family protein methyltransferase [Actinoallomurus spadix]MCO5985025.1 HemK family protein methyltransferase [Actinoallomurus spadix]